MAPKRFIVLFLPAFIFLNEINGQVNYRIINWTVKQGLSQGSTHKMLRDSLGFLWIATDNGLNKFDGTTFRQYIHGQGSLSKGFRGSEALGIVEDSLHNIWIGTEEGMNRYVTRSDSFQHFITPRNNVNMTSYSMPLVAYKDQVICWEITGNIVSYNINSLKRKILFENVSWPASSYYTLNNLSYDKETETIWAPYKNKIFRLRLKQMEYQFISLPLHSGTCQATLVENSSLLLGTSTGLLSLNLSDFSFKKEKWSKPFSSSKILSLSKKENGVLLVAVENKGLYMYDRVSQIITNYRAKPSGINTLSTNDISNLYTDKENIIWASSGQKAIDQIFPYEQPFEFFNLYSHNKINPHSVKCFAEDEKNNIWLGTQNGGIFIYNPVKKESARFKHPGIKSDSIQSLKFNKSKSTLWIATNSGLLKYENLKNTMTPILFNDESGFQIKQPITIHQLVTFNDSNILVATSAGAFSVSERGNTAKRIAPVKDNVFFIGNQHNKFIFSLWDFDPVMYKYHSGSWTKEVFPFDDVTVGCIVFDETRNVFWVGTDRGLLMTDSLFKRIRLLNRDDGLPDNFIWGILLDTYGNVWTTTNKGIAKFIPNENEIKSYAPADGIQGFEYNAYAYFLASDKTVYFGGKEGFDHINPASLKNETATPKIYFSAFKVNNKIRSKNTAVNFLDNVTLPVSENSFTISTDIIDFNNPGRATLRYKLVPAEKDWQEVKAPYDIRYSGLSPGKYVLEVASANTGANKLNSIRQFNIIILPPLWQRWWFQSLFAVLLLLTVLLLAQIRINQIRKREKENTRSIKRMAELELQSLRAQLNPHFMFNSLNAIQELILLNENEKSQSYLARFSKLLRILLENADKPFITLQREIDFLNLYISLENLRIPDLQFSLSVDSAIRTEQIQIPNMILQPYIENAIWHGLSHKVGTRILKLKIKQVKDATEYEIEDNGVGRNKSQEMKNQFRKEHKSKGMELISKRLELLSRKFGSVIQVNITDVLINEEVKGTLINIKVPLSITNESN